ncbi:hypothetical protein RF11_07057 [Thelohanellus kitauei]|uniref:ISXO2-like transposase domain-containing protein n=1 Tax=Thelohanellus kitauei TaxID=669202 RepID=A0A0C2NEM3_THEKT|nr:hypothetical protein RF11_07057 [Thelohanellus kitauei]
MEKDVHNVGKVWYSSITTIQSLKMVKFGAALRVNAIRQNWRASKIVEIEENFLVKGKYYKEPSSKGERRFLIWYVNERIVEVLAEITLKRIDPGTIIISEVWKAYQNCSQKITKSKLKMHKIREGSQAMFKKTWLSSFPHSYPTPPHDFECVADFFC